MRGMGYKGILLGIGIFWSLAWTMQLRESQDLFEGKSGSELAFSIAVKNNADEVAKMFLLASGKSVIYAYDAEGLTPLHWAAFYGHLAMINLMLGNPENTVDVWSTGVRKVMPLHLAVSCGSLSHVWLSGSNVGMYGDKIGDAATYLSIVRAFLDRGADPCVGGEQSAFCYACQAGVPEVVSMLVHCGKLDEKTLKSGLTYAWDASIAREIQTAIDAQTQGFSLNLLFE